MTENEATVNDVKAEELAAALFDGIRNGASLKDLQGVSNDTMDGIYAFAYRFYQQGKLDEAEALFRFLCVYDFYNAEYALGFGAVCQLKKAYSKAIDLYAIAYSLSKDDYRPMFHTGQCQLFMGKVPLARRCFEIVAERAHDSSLKLRATSYLAGLDQVSVDANCVDADSQL